jgi:hypothetical protein
MSKIQQKNNFMMEAWVVAVGIKQHSCILQNNNTKIFHKQYDTLYCYSPFQTLTIITVMINPS